MFEELHLAPHPEGGFFRQIYKSPQRVLRGGGDSRAALTIIHFLLRAGEISRWHRVSSDEVWRHAEPLGAYALVACFVAPGFEFEDFTMMANDAAAAAALPEELRRLL